MSATEKIQQSGGPFLESLRNAAAENPAAAALIGAGVLWLFAGRVQIGSMAKAGAARVADAAADAQRATSDAMASTWRSAKENVSGLASRAAAQVKRAGDDAREASPDLSDPQPESGASMPEQRAAISRRVADGLQASAETFSSARAQLSDVLQSQPLTLGLIGLAVGAAVAAALPSTRIEDETLGETSDALRDQAKQQIDRAANAASAAATKATEEARAQNLTPDALKAKVEETATKMSGVAGSAAETLRDKMRSAP
ncbi:MAG TPA: hypothetical protein VKV96_08385 [Roseiarcus sp.]|nr:hypothetical protein [Roseiarcus sp.]